MCPTRKKILEKIKEISEDNPELRFCQLICNCFAAHSGQIYYKEDSDLLSRLEITYAKDNSSKSK